ncbi:MAG: ABC transporter substrate-binding protein [Firmicutes bacterium]|nr:ABC transporter substrate-binding protein [Bacillota bacterium]
MKKFARYLLFIVAVSFLLSVFLSGCIAVKVDNKGKEGSTVESDKPNIDEQKPVEVDKPGPITQDRPKFIKNETETQITLVDPLDNEVTLDKKPQRVVILMNSILDLWYMAGGTAIARVSGTENVPPEAEGIEQVGNVGSPNIERIIALEPDLVIMTSTMAAHRELKDIFEQNRIKYLYVNYMVYDDFINYLDLFTRLTGREDIFKTEVAAIKDKVNNTIKKVSSQKKPKVLILFASSTSVKCELPSGLVGDMVNMLGADNIVKDSPVKEDTKVEFSMERIVERDPDIILITTMGDVEKAKARIKEDIESNQAWAALRAVKEDNVHYLPKDLYIYKPNARYPEAVENLAKILYPGVYEK